LGTAAARCQDGVSWGGEGDGPTRDRQADVHRPRWLAGGRYSPPQPRLHDRPWWAAENTRAVWPQRHAPGPWRPTDRLRALGWGEGGGAGRPRDPRCDAPLDPVGAWGGPHGSKRGCRAPGAARPGRASRRQLGWCARWRWTIGHQWGGWIDAPRGSGGRCAVGR